MCHSMYFLIVGDYFCFVVIIVKKIMNFLFYVFCFCGSFLVGSFVLLYGLTLDGVIKHLLYGFVVMAVGSCVLLGFEETFNFFKKIFLKFIKRKSSAPADDDK